MECVPTENTVSAKIRLSIKAVDYCNGHCHGQQESFASADSITIGRIGERHGP